MILELFDNPTEDKLDLDIFVTNFKKFETYY